MGNAYDIEAKIWELRGDSPDFSGNDIPQTNMQADVVLFSKGGSLSKDVFGLSC